MYLAERLDVPRLLDLQLPEGNSSFSQFLQLQVWVADYETAVCWDLDPEFANPTCLFFKN
jgi:hypothetical protein